MSIWQCPPDYLAHLSGWSGGLLVGIVLGFWIRGYHIYAQPTEHSQQPPQGETGGKI